MSSTSICQANRGCMTPTASGVFRYSTFRFFSHVAACNPDGSIILTIHIPINFIRFLL
ncbi:Uncharacterised protein [Segatella copri]|nr:Uncharacterised protein [Segatella copri]